VRNARRHAHDEPHWALSHLERLCALMQAVARRPKDSIAVLLAAMAGGFGMLNALFFQPGPHPAPLLAPRPLKVAAAPDTTGTAVTVLPRPRPSEFEPLREPPPVAPSSPPGRSRAEIVADIQRELARRGYYDGAVDGVYGGRTDNAIRDFEQAAQLKPPSSEPSEALLRAIKASPGKTAALTPPLPIPRPAVTAPASIPAAARQDPIADILGPSKRVMAVQRALADYGYGQIRITGIVNPEPETAIEKFERERKLPITGQISDRLVRELAAMTGRPLDH
jgi:peptidoglycan hydrolase-like protein with peptidoglycan-binding domain